MFGSDDELEPYDMSNDRKSTTVKPPLYLRDCVEGLLNSEKPDQVEVCITTASTLIRKHSSTVKEVNTNTLAFNVFAMKKHKGFILSCCIV